MTYGDFVSAAGDLDGDGWLDVFVADTSYDNWTGVVDVWMRPREGEDTGTVDSGPTDSGPTDTSGADSAVVDSGTETGDSAAPDSDVLGTADSGGDKLASSECGCATGGVAPTALLPLLLLLGRRRPTP